MPLSDINVDRVLTHQEVVTMLTEDAVKEDAKQSRILKHWDSTLRHWKQSSGTLVTTPSDKVRSLVWKEELTYIFQLRENPKIKIPKQSLDGRKYGYSYVTDLCRLAKMPRQSQLEGLSIGDIEEISTRFIIKESPIKCLLDAGFTLDLIVPKDFLGL
jgi:hypothetical protein